MTDFLWSHRLRTLCATCAVVGGFFSAGAASAGSAWDLFQAHCLDPFEHQTEPVVEGLEPMAPEATQLRYRGPEALVLVVDAAPEEGLRSCAVLEPGAEALDASYLSWVNDATEQQLYKPEDGILASEEWIEPQVHVEAFMDGTGAVYMVVETDLES